MSNSTIENIYKEISLLPNYEKSILLSRLIFDISIKKDKESDLNLYELKGIGKEIWDTIDAQSYVDSERSSWE